MRENQVLKYRSIFLYLVCLTPYPGAQANEYKAFGYPLEKCAGLDFVSDIVESYQLTNRKIEIGLPDSYDPRVMAVKNNFNHRDKTFTEILSFRKNVESGAGSIPEEIFRFRFKDLQRFIENPDLIEPVLIRVNIANSSNLSKKIEQFETWSRAIVESDYIDSRRNQANTLTDRDFKIMSFLEGFEIQNFAKLYRIDSRPPEQIKKQRGFYSRNDWTTIAMHSHRSSLGGSFISTTTAPGNKELLKVEPIMDNAVKVNENGLSPTLTKASEAHDFTGVKFVLQAYEYEIQNVEGTLPKENARVTKEMEVVTPYVSVSSIGRVRKVTFVLDWQWDPTFTNEIKRELVVAEFGEWSDI